MFGKYVTTVFKFLIRIQYFNLFANFIDLLFLLFFY